MRNKAVLLLLLMQVLLVFALAVSLGTALRSPPQSEWAALVADIERQHALVPFVQAYGQNDTWFSASNPPLSPDAAEEVEKHVPRMWQRSGTQVNIRVSHEMIWTPNDVVDFAHYIHYVFVRNSSSSEIVYVGILEPGDTSVDIDTTVLGGLGGQGFLVPYEFCNVHGLWRGEALQTVDPVSWNLTTASLKLFGQVEEECQGNIYLLDDSHSLQLSLINRYDEVVVDVADAVSLQATFVFPRGQFFGLGFGDSMLGADMMIAAERDGTALCADFHTTGNSNRYSGPDIDAQQDVQVVAATLQDGVATLVCTKSLRSADPDDKAVLNQRENLIWSFQEVDGEPSTTSNAFLKRHGATNRGYILNADLGGSGGELAIANSRDKRDLQVAHGMLMYMIWGINICVGAMIARYAHDRAWGIGAHRIIQSINTMLTLPGYYLSQRFVDVHFQSAHAFIGTTLVYTSILQAGLGTAAYLCSKYSKKVAREYPKSDALSDENKLFIAGIEDEHGQRELLHEVYHKLDTLSTPRAFEITAYVENTISQGIPSCMPPAIAVYILTRMRQTVIRPIHRVVGRLLPIIAYVQIYLGLDRLQANNVISAIINMWTILVVLILIYKESELQLNLPHGVAPKLFLLKDRLQRLFCSCCPRTQDPKPDANDGDDDDDGDIDGAATGGGEAGNRSSRNLLEKGSIRDHDLERSHSRDEDLPLGEDGAAKRGEIMTLVLALALWVSLASALRVPPQSEWAALVADIERQHALVPFVQTFGQNDTWFSASNPPSAPDSLEVVGKHVPQMWQRSDTQVNIRVSHEMNWNPENGQDLHYIHAVFIRNNATMDIVFVGILEPGDTSVDVDASVFGGLGGQGFLVPYEFCNIHGLWQGDALQTFDAASWNLIAESLRLFDKVEEECQGNIYLLDDTHSLQLSLINRKGEVVVDVADATSLQVTFVFPRGHFLGLGFGDSMLGTDMIIAAERDGTALCADFHTSGSTSRSSGPDIDAQQDVQVVSVTLEDKLVTLVCTKSLYSSDPDDKAVLNQRENLIWSFQEVDGEPSTTSNAFLKRHAATNRGYILDADLGGSGGELAIANSRDKRDLQVAHGMLMYMIWGINICVGAMIARYAHDRAWGIGAHRIIQGINTMLTMPGYYLSQRFVEVHFLSAHAIIGTILVYSSILQAGLGTIAYLCSKYSKKVAKEFLQSEMLSQENKDFIAKIEAEHGQRELLHEIYHKLDTLSTPRAFEITAFIEKTVNRGIPSCVPPGIAIYVLTRLRQTVIRPIHRIVGRIMPVFAYAQIYLGLDRLQANTVIIAIINMWTILVAIILIYKESERQFGLPHGVLSKLLYFKRLIRSLLCRQKKHDGKRDSFSGSDQARANVNSGDLERASIQETGRSIAGEDSSLTMTERSHGLRELTSFLSTPNGMGLLAVAVAVTATLLTRAQAAEDGLARTPPMGWRSWNAYQGRVNQDIIIAAAKAMVKRYDANGKPVETGSDEEGTSLLDLGYDDVGLDDNWQLCGAGFNNSFHNEDGYPIVNLERFPDMKAMTNEIHSLGLKAGWYGNNCICREKNNIWKNESHYVGDVQATFDFGFDSTKLDGCGAFLDLDLFYELFNKGSRSGTIMIENCHWGKTVPTLDSCPFHFYRTSGDIRAKWKSMFANLQSTRKFQGEKPLSRPGCWAYPDMLEVGLLANEAEDRTHFAAWVITSSPLILGHRITDEKVTTRIWPIISNKLAISINQEWAGHPGRVVQEVDGAGMRKIQAWAKPLPDNRVAVLFINDNDPSLEPDEVSLSLSLLGIQAANQVTSAIDVWSGEDRLREVVISSSKGDQDPHLLVKVAGHDSVFLRLSYTDSLEPVSII
ncbi:Alpha-galactosidase [Hondaea fermentalgiana]|uniref:Alpha-galactosidase n=1 Tax=Hondaea fermentalgiana TaxID=2315210 RepID=A0A2R5GUC8_9STRA|nr:Alpha-galactosidase [Hondaea fermentalgiana]|eukprot:GBG33929.1 Alpha-galactosidase [Hondaea fermentalgiana]